MGKRPKREKFEGAVWAEGGEGAITSTGGEDFDHAQMVPCSAKW